jgi:type III secretion protein L
MLIRLNLDGATACEHGIVRAGDAQTLLDAQQIRDEVVARCEATLAQAQADAQALVDQAQAQAEDIVQQARQDAQAHMDSGMQQTRGMLEHAQQSIADAVESGRRNADHEGAVRWHEQHAALVARSEQMVQGLNDKLATIVLTAVERVITADSRPALYERALKNVQSLMRGASTLSLRLHPDDQPAAQEALQSLQAQEASAVELVPDANLPSGSCIFESELGVLDASLSVQLEGLRLALNRATAIVAMDAAAQAQQEATAQQQAQDALYQDQLSAQGMLSDTAGGSDAVMSSYARPAGEALDGDDDHMPYHDEDDEDHEHEHEHEEDHHEHDDHDHEEHAA